MELICDLNCCCYFHNYTQDLNSDCHFTKAIQWKPFKNDEFFFLFHLKSAFRSQGIEKTA